MFFFVIFLLFIFHCCIYLFLFCVICVCTTVVQNNMCVEWFRGRHLALAMGVTISVSRLVSPHSSCLSSLLSSLSPSLSLFALISCLSYIFFIRVRCLPSEQRRQSLRAQGIIEWHFGSVCSSSFYLTQNLIRMFLIFFPQLSYWSVFRSSCLFSTMLWTNMQKEISLNFLLQISDALCH